MATIDLKTAMATYGKLIDLELRHDDITYTGNQIVSCNISYEGALLTSVMRQAEIELCNVGGETFARSIKGAHINVILTVTAAGASVQKDFGMFIVKDTEYDDDTSSVRLTCYDQILFSMVPYVPVCDFSLGDVTLGAYLEAICTHLCIPYTAEDFANSGTLVDGEKYDDSYTFRDVLSEIAQAAGGTIGIKNDTLCVLYPTVTEHIVDPTNLKTLKIGELYGPVNSVVLSRTPQEDNLYMRDESAESWQEIRIANNQLMDSHREDYLPGLFNALQGLSFYQFELTSFGIGYIELCDLCELETLDGSRYPVMWLSDEIEITQGIVETASAEAPKAVTETDYSAADTTDRRLNQTILKVNKQEQTIEALVSTTESTTNELTGQLENLTRKVEATVTADEVNLQITRAIEGIDSVTTSTGYTFGADGLDISREGDEIANTIDHKGMEVKRGDDPILTANTDGVNALNLTARQYLTIGKNSRFEDYQGGTGCFYIGGADD